MLDFRDKGHIIQKLCYVLVLRVLGGNALFEEEEVVSNEASSEGEGDAEQVVEKPDVGQIPFRDKGCEICRGNWKKCVPRQAKHPPTGRWVRNTTGAGILPG